MPVVVTVLPEKEALECFRGVEALSPVGSHRLRNDVTPHVRQGELVAKDAHKCFDDDRQVDRQGAPVYRLKNPGMEYWRKDRVVEVGA